MKGGEEMAEIELKKSHNDYEVERVPFDERKGLLSVAMVSAGFCICMSGLFTGSAMAAGLNFNQAIISAIAGNIILSFYGGAIGAAGAREGYSSSRLAIYSFGKQGFKIVSLVLALTMAGWFSVQCGFFGNTINAMFPQAGIITNPRFAGLWGGILMLLTAYYGYKGLSLLSNVAVPLISILAILGVIMSIDSIGGWASAMSIIPSEKMTVSTGIVMAVGSFAAGASAQADITRYAKDVKTAWLGTIFGYLLANTFIILAGYLVALTTGIGDLPAAMLALGLGIPALLVLILAQWTTNDNNLYTSSLGLSNIFNVKKSKLVLIIGIFGSILGAFGIADYFIGWLSLLGIGVPPMAGVIIADYYIIRKQSYNFDFEDVVSDWNKNAIIAWSGGSFVGFFIKSGIASLNGLIAAIILHVALTKLTTSGKK